MRRDPLASTLAATLVIGGPLVIVALIKLVLLLAVAGGPAPGSARAFVFLLAFAVVLGPIVAATRRWLGPERSLRAKNLATGVLVGAGYAVGCTLVFGGDMDLQGTLLLGLLTALGFGWAVASGLNEAFAETRR